MTRASLTFLTSLVVAGCRDIPTTPFAAAAAEGRLAEVQRLLAEGAPPAAPDGHGYAPLHYAARGGHLAVIAALLAAGAPVDQSDQGANGWTPLLHAIHTRQEAAVRALLQAGADPNRRGGGPPPLLMAAGYGEDATVRELLTRGADPRAEANGVNALWAAAGGGAIADITDGPPIGSCSPATVEALLAAAPDLRLPRGLSTRILGFLPRSGECRALVDRLSRS